jgi:hypothetical protein
MTIVTSHYRYKRTPRKRAKAAPIEGPAVLTISDKTRKRVKAAQSDDATASAPAESKAAVVTTSRKRAGASAAPAANDDRKPKPSAPPPPAAARPSAIVTARKPGKRYAEVPEVDEAEHRRVGDLADAMMAEFKRVIAAKTRGEKP